MSTIPLGRIGLLALALLTLTIAPAAATAAPDVDGDGDPALDPDDDGLYEDVNGDGALNVGDVQALWANRDDPEVQNHVPLFDFNGDGAVNVGDVQALAAELDLF